MSDLKDAIKNTPVPDAGTGEFGAGVRASEGEGVEGGVYFNRGFDNGRSVNVEAGLSEKKGWGFKAFYKRVFGVRR